MKRVKLGPFAINRTHKYIENVVSSSKDFDTGHVA